jgi:hypothetical protein
MEQVVESHDLVKRFLLGQLDEKEYAIVEERVFTDQVYFTEFVLVEEELIDDFVYGVLSDDEQERMQKHFFVDPERLENLRITKAIERYVSEFLPDESRDSEWEDTLREAQKNRLLLGALISADWTGLRVLAVLEASSKNLAEVAAFVSERSNEIAPVLVRLVESGLADQAGDRFFCTRLGVETLHRVLESAH